MGREGLMDDTGYHGFDHAQEFAEEYCQRCVHTVDGGECELHGRFICDGDDFELEGASE